MDGYPSDYIQHNVPLVVISGLGTPESDRSNHVDQQHRSLQERGFRIATYSPDVEGAAAQELLACFHDFDARHAAWNNRPGVGKMGTMGFAFRNVGRSMVLPPHKAAPPETSVDSGDGEDQRQPSNPMLHSPVSPLTPASPIFPDGIMTPLWFAKHQVLLPSALLAFFNFTLDEGQSTLRDNSLKNEINAMRTSIASSGYRTRVVVVLVAAEDQGSDNNVLERLANIRRATSLDPKSLYYTARTSTAVELRALVGTILTALQPVCIEYYRDLSKHARRKRNRGSVPPPTAPPTSGTSQTLSTQGWNVRYETKMGYFAEFRQEMDAACRNYEAAYEALFDGEVLEGIAGWSPRFEEARLLADILAIRILRCLLWTSQTTSAVMSWTNHRARVRDLVDRRGKGTSSYGWAAWEARWCKVMAELLDKVDLPVLHISEALNSSEMSQLLPHLFANPEKSYVNEQRLPPWDCLHHQGYWLNQATKHTRTRRELALSIPAEDRSLPGQSPASALASRAHLYDTYLCPQPHIEGGTDEANKADHDQMIIDTMRGAAKQFQSRQQVRSTERVNLEIAQEYMLAGRSDEAMEVLRPLWQSLSWRMAGWWDLVGRVSHLIGDCARQNKDFEILLAVEWELLCHVIPNKVESDFMRCIDLLKPDYRPRVEIQFENTAPTFSGTFLFQANKGNAGIVLNGQLIVTSNAHRSTKPVLISHLTVFFEGGLKDYVIEHSSETSPAAVLQGSNSVQFYEHPWNVSTASSTDVAQRKDSDPAAANLIFEPGQTKVFSIDFMPREAAEVAALKVVMQIRAENFDFDVHIPFYDPSSQLFSWKRGHDGLKRSPVTANKPHTVTILPKPPKVNISMPKLRNTYYIGEDIEVPIHITNNEEDVAEIRLSVTLAGSRGTTPVLRWTSVDTSSEASSTTEETSSVLKDFSLGEMAPQEECTKSVTFRALPDPAEFSLVIEAEYSLKSDPETTLTKQMKEELSFIGPFEANYDFYSRVNSEPWPSYFHIDHDPDQSKATGIKQLWTLQARIASFGVEPLVVEKSSLHVIESKCGIIQTRSSAETSEPFTLDPKEMIDKSFPFDVQKSSLDDRRAAIISFRIDFDWHRKDEPDKTISSTLLVPLLTVAFGEPRVLASCRPSSANPSVLELMYTLENPSTHFLTFSLTMETNEDFAFSGPKMITMQLVPLSRNQVKYNLLPTRQGVWIRPMLRVVDTGFGQELRPIAAEGCKADKKGFVVWVDVQD